MKRVIVIMSGIVMSYTVFAMDINNTTPWHEIQQNNMYQIQKKQINFQGQLLNVFDVCILDDTTLRSRKKLSTYEWDNTRNDDLGPANTQKDFLTTDINYLKSYSNGDGTREQQESHPLTYSLSVTKVYSGTQFSKEYQIPAC